MLTLANKKQAISWLSGQLNTLSPLATLSRGYAIAKLETSSKTSSGAAASATPHKTGQSKTSKIITSSKQVKIDDNLTIQLHKGALSCIVKDKFS